VRGGGALAGIEGVAGVVEVETEKARD